MCVTSSGISKARCTGVPLQSDKSVAKDMPRVETFSDSTVCSSAAGFAMRTRSGILRSNRSARRRSVRVMGTTFSPLLIREPWNQIDMPGQSRHEDALFFMLSCRRAGMAELTDAPNKQPVFISTCVLLDEDLRRKKPRIHNTVRRIKKRRLQVVDFASVTNAPFPFLTVPH